jgi:hypothetical protein
VKVAELIVEAFMALLKVAVTVVLIATPEAPFAGTVDTTEGATSVVKVHTKLAASALPDGSFAPVVIVAVYNVLATSRAVGVKVAVVPA